MQVSRFLIPRPLSGWISCGHLPPHLLAFNVSRRHFRQIRALQDDIHQRSEVQHQQMPSDSSTEGLDAHPANAQFEAGDAFEQLPPTDQEEKVRSPPNDKRRNTKDKKPETQVWSSLLHTSTLGRHMSILVLRDSERNQGHGYAKTHLEAEPISVFDINAKHLLQSIEEQKAIPGQEEVNRAIDSVRPFEDNDQRHPRMAISRREFHELFRTLIRSHNSDQLTRYVTINMGTWFLKQPRRKTDRRKSGSSISISAWHPRDGVSREANDIDLSDLKSSDRKNSLVDVLIRGAWGIEIMEDMEEEGSIDVTVPSSADIQLITAAAANPYASSGLASLQLVQSEIFNHQNLIKLSGERFACKNAAQAIDHALRSTYARQIDLVGIKRSAREQDKAQRGSVLEVVQRVAAKFHCAVELNRKRDRAFVKAFDEAQFRRFERALARVLVDLKAENRVVILSTLSREPATSLPSGMNDGPPLTNPSNLLNGRLTQPAISTRSQATSTAAHTSPSLLELQERVANAIDDKQVGNPFVTFPHPSTQDQLEMKRVHKGSQDRAPPESPSEERTGSKILTSGISLAKYSAEFGNSLFQPVDQTSSMKDLELLSKDMNEKSLSRMSKYLRFSPTSLGLGKLMTQLALPLDKPVVPRYSLRISFSLMPPIQPVPRSTWHKNAMNAPTVVMSMPLQRDSDILGLGETEIIMNQRIVDVVQPQAALDLRFWRQDYLQNSHDYDEPLRQVYSEVKKAVEKSDMARIPREMQTQIPLWIKTDKGPRLKRFPSRVFTASIERIEELVFDYKGYELVYRSTNEELEDSRTEKIMLRTAQLPSETQRNADWETSKRQFIKAALELGETLGHDADVKNRENQERAASIGKSEVNGLGHGQSTLAGLDEKIGTSITASA